MPDRVPPQALDVERRVLGSMLLSPEALDEGIERLTERYFYATANIRIFRAIRAIFDGGTQVDIVTVAEELRRRGEIESVGSEPYLAELTELSTGRRISDWCEILRRKSVLRGTIQICSQATADAFRDEAEADPVLDRVQGELANLGAEAQPGGYVRAGDDLRGLFEEIEATQKSGGVSGLSTGLERLDSLTSGLHCGELWILAGRTSMGKSALAGWIALHVAQTTGRPVLFLTLEMSRKQVLLRLICSQAGVPVNVVRSGKLRKDDWSKLTSAATPIYECPLYMDDKQGQSASYIRSKARRLRRETGDLALIVIDYIQKQQAEEKHGSRQEAVNAIAQADKSLAMDLDVPALGLAQFSREVERRPGDKRPQLSDLRESGGLEQEADGVIGIYREAVYKQGDDSAKQNVAELIVLKQRNGPIGTVEVACDPRCMRFGNLDDDWTDTQTSLAGFESGPGTASWARDY